MCLHDYCFASRLVAMYLNPAAVGPMADCSISTAYSGALFLLKESIRCVLL